MDLSPLLSIELSCFCSMLFTVIAINLAVVVWHCCQPLKGD